MLVDGRFAYRTTAANLVRWVVREQNRQPSAGHINYEHDEVAQVTYGGFWHVNPNMAGAQQLDEAVDDYLLTH